jgi:hypothetical protein
MEMMGKNIVIAVSYDLHPLNHPHREGKIDFLQDLSKLIKNKSKNNPYGLLTDFEIFHNIF